MVLLPQELQQATASEPLTLEEEYAMQRSWRQDADKLTFIACTALADGSVVAGKAIEPGVLDGESAMFGDVNLFLAKEEEDEEAEENGAVNGDKAQPQGLVGEVEIMIARKSLQGNGYGRAILVAFLWYILTHIEGIQDEYCKRQDVGSGTTSQSAVLKYLRAKIDGQNSRSIRLFESLGFRKVSETPNYFGELELWWWIEGFDAASLKEELRACAETEEDEPKMLQYGQC